MYIRRKVFSVLADEMGDERLYSVNETLFEGYEYDEVDDRYFADYDAEIAGAAKGAGIGAAALGAGYGAYVGGKKIANTEAYKKSLNWVKEQAAKGGKYAEAAKEALSKKGKEGKEAILKLAKESKEKSKSLLERGKKAIVESKPVVWVKNNPKLATGIAAGTAITGAAAYGAHKAHQKKNQKKNNN